MDARILPARSQASLRRRQASPGMTSVKLAGEAALVLADAGAHAADDLVHRAAGGERRSGLGKGHALLSHMRRASVVAADPPRASFNMRKAITVCTS
jgi:hypothetical protein